MKERYIIMRRWKILEI